MSQKAGHSSGREYTSLPHALLSFEQLAARLAGRQPAFFLDFDGTLSPIVPRPEDAELLAGLRATLRALAGEHFVAIVSGRDRKDVRQRVGLDQLVYAGSHGMDISGPGGLRMVHDGARQRLGELDAAEGDLRSRLAGLPGAQVERKRLAVAVHYRNVAAGQVGQVEAAVSQVHAGLPGLVRTAGKKVFELRPDVPWHKGRAVLWLLEVMKLNRPEVGPIYIGDDLTDEDAFAVLRGRGVGVLVGEHGGPTAADFRLDSPAEVGRLLERLRRG